MFAQAVITILAVTFIGWVAYKYFIVPMGKSLQQSLTPEKPETLHEKTEKLKDTMENLKHVKEEISVSTDLKGATDQLKSEQDVLNDLDKSLEGTKDEST